MKLIFKKPEPGNEQKEIALPAALPAEIFDIKAAMAVINEYDKQVEEMFLEAKNMVINNEKGNEDATALGTLAMSLYKKIITAKEKVPNYIEAKEYVEKVDNFFQMRTEKLYTTRKNAGDTVVSMAKAKISQWTVVKLAEEQKQKQIADKAAEELNKKLKAEGFKGEAVAPIIPAGQKTVRTETGSSHPKTTWEFDATEPCLPSNIISELIHLANGKTPKDREGLDRVAREANDIFPYIVILFEDTKIREAIKKGARDPAIKGIHIFEKVSTIFRTRG